MFLLSGRYLPDATTRMLQGDFFFLITGHLAPGPGDESIVRMVLRAREMFSHYIFFIYIYKYTLSRTSMFPSGGCSKGTDSLLEEIETKVDHENPK
ncbi:hypothetical protein AVEN_271899-1 [Araneus ventricosus]|uniref:Uncharacterized protein n=1 Tax=Araneus ventricosus TaxID=182803 RepID=A0A4Y2B2H6_ARAVE|nr:hypothetical protein AVEN_271899-1 [Araneus ventricosus]